MERVSLRGFQQQIGHYYMASAGLEGIWLKAGDAKNSYLKPRFSLSGTYQFNPNNSTQLSYELTNRSPSVGQLNPYNTSTDPLVITKVILIFCPTKRMR